MPRLLARFFGRWRSPSEARSVAAEGQAASGPSAAPASEVAGALGTALGGAMRALKESGLSSADPAENTRTLALLVRLCEEETFSMAGAGERFDADELVRRAVLRFKAQRVGRPEQVVFVREDLKEQRGALTVHRIHKGPDAASAQAFLEQHPVFARHYHIVVETPEGNYCRDIQGIHKE